MEVFMILREIATHYPGQSYTNNELIKAHYDKEAELDDALDILTKKNFTKDILGAKGFFENLGVKKRNILADPYNCEKWWDEHIGSDPFSKEGAIAYEKLMFDKEPLTEKDRLIILANIPDGYAPNIGYTVLSKLKLRNENFKAPSILALQGEGCSGFISGLTEAAHYIRAVPNSRVVILSLELMATPLHHPKIQESLIGRIHKAPKEELPLLTQELIGLGIQRYLFGDGCAAALCSPNGDGIKFTEIGKWTDLHPNDTHLLEQRGIGTKALPCESPFGYFFQQPSLLIERLKIAYLPLAKEKLTSMKLKPKHYAVHTGSNKILGLVKHELGLNEENIRPSQEILRNQGNMNATTGAAILANFLVNGQHKNIAAIFFGVGFAMQVATSS
jgi:predicted naringenin-chalcone synthase